MEAHGAEREEAYDKQVVYRTGHKFGEKERERVERRIEREGESRITWARERESLRQTGDVQNETEERGKGGVVEREK